MVIYVLAPSFRSMRYRDPHHHHPLYFGSFPPRAQTITLFSFNVDTVGAHAVFVTHMDPSNDMGGAGAAARDDLRAQAGREGFN